MALTQISTGMLASGDGTVDLNIDNGTFVVDVSTSRVGIGNSSPSVKLDVTGAMALSGNADFNGNLDVNGTALVTGVLTTTAATVFNGGFASNADSTLGTDKKIIFRDSAIHISSTADGDLSIAADDEIDLTSTLIDVNGALTQDGGAVFNEASADVDFRVESNGNANMFFVDGGNNRVGIGTAPTDGTLHVQTASAGTVTASTQADDIVIENNAEGGMTIITPNDQSARIRFTSPATNGDVGGAHVFYRQNINKMQVGTAVSGGVLSLASGASNETMLLDGSGNVSIGTALSPQKFNVLGTHENAGFYRDYSGSGMAATYLQIGRKDSNGDLVSGVRISGGGDNNVAASHNGYFEIATRKAGAFVSLLSSYGGGQELVVNENSVDMDFRLESDNLTHALFVEGSTGNVGISVVPPAFGTAYANINIGTTGSLWASRTGTSFTAMGDNNYHNGSGPIARNSGPGSLYYQLSGQHIWANMASVSAGATQTEVTRMRLEAAGDLNLLDGNLKVAAGHGIDFSANANATTMTSELLDDYEEGTWTAGFSAISGGTVTGVNTAQAYYTKIGRHVAIYYYVNAINLAQLTTGSYVIFTGLPFPASSYADFQWSYHRGGNAITGGYVQTGASYVYLTDTSGIEIQQSANETITAIIGSAIYMTNS